MAEAFAEIALLALAIAASPFPIVPVVLILGGAHVRTSAPAFVTGWLLGLVLIGGALLLVAPDLGSEADEGRKAWARLVLGALLLIAALRKLHRRRVADEPKPLPGWMRSVGGFTWARAFAVGLALAANPKNLLLITAAVAAILSAELSTDGQAIVYAAFVVIASLGVAVPVCLYFALGDRAAAFVAATQRWLQRNNVLLTAVVVGAIGAKLTYDGIVDLAGG